MISFILNFQNVDGFSINGCSDRWMKQGEMFKSVRIKIFNFLPPQAHHGVMLEQVGLLSSRCSLISHKSEDLINLILVSVIGRLLNITFHLDLFSLWLVWINKYINTDDVWWMVTNHLQLFEYQVVILDTAFTSITSWYVVTTLWTSHLLKVRNVDWWQVSCGDHSLPSEIVLREKMK